MPSMQAMQQYVLPNALSFAEVDGVVIAQINTEQAQAEISLQGGQLLSWQPKGAEPVIWMSDEAKPSIGKAMRGGVPICWPWFGPHDSEADFPAHGFARVADWECKGSQLLADGSVSLHLELVCDGGSKEWPYATLLQVEFRIGTQLEIKLTTRNLSDEAFVVSEALHTYFQISDIEQVSVRGLEGVAYYDKVSEAEAQSQQGDIQFSVETDRVYINSTQTCVIDDPAMGRKMVIEKSGSDSTVVWNPWLAKANRMGDLGEQGWRTMLCVESANAFDNVVTVQPQQSHSLSVVYSVL